RSMLWRSDDAPHVLILGSIHFWDGALPDWILEVHGGADAIVFESDIRNPMPPPCVPPGLSLTALDSELWLIVEGTALGLGLDAQAVHELSDQYPFAIGGRLGALSLTQAGAHFEQGPDAVLTERTSNPLSLETFPEFYRILYQETSLAEQIASLRITIKQLGELPKRFLRALENWRMGEPEAVLDALGFSRHFNEFPGLAAGLFANRHKLWLPRAEYYIRRAAELGHRLLIVVGCSHLAGPQTFLADLRDRYGYKFRRF
ncbi:MAG TPA: TraB/GumN family protein, partial [Gemmatimonadales bacterium]|nr:TraB/GumN family protein [Gemmatimonadales bacterium]